jgi:DNA-binding NarL/FixJ family response regulator
MNPKEKIRLIIADDDPIVLAIHTQYFEKKSNFEVIATAADGREAVEKIREFRPDLALLDYQMPHKDGFAVLAEVRKNELPTRVILISGEDLTEKWEEAGADGFYRKGQSLTGLLPLIEQALSAETAHA